MLQSNLNVWLKNYIFECCIENGQFKIFQTLNDSLCENKLRFNWQINEEIIHHLKGLKLAFKKYFSNMKKKLSGWQAFLKKNISSIENQ